MLRSDWQLGRVVSCGILLFVFFALGGVSRAGESTYDSGNRRDPFVPLPEEEVSPEAVSTGVNIEGIIYDPGAQSIAILNGKPYQRGETVGDATVLRIFKDHVVLSVKGEEKTLWIRTEEKP